MEGLLKDYLSTLHESSTVFIIGDFNIENNNVRKIREFDYDTFSSCVCGAQVTSFLISYEEFHKLTSEVLYYMLTRIRGIDVKYNKSKIGILYEFDDTYKISWF